jgi:hypothetical protein
LSILFSICWSAFCDSLIEAACILPFGVAAVLLECLIVGDDVTPAIAAIDNVVHSSCW